MRISLDQQRDIYDRHAAASVDELLRLLDERRDALIELGRARAFRDVGVHEYGDATYWLSPERLAEEVAAELADAIFYMGVVRAREGGELPEPA